MTSAELKSILESPEKVAQIPVEDLREQARLYPYSQVMQLLYAIRLRYSSEHLFNQQLGKTAALTNDRSVLFELFEDKPKLGGLQSHRDQVDEILETPRAEPELKVVEDEPPKTPIVLAPKEQEEPQLEKREGQEPKQAAVKQESPRQVDIPKPAPKPDPVPELDPAELAKMTPQERVQAILARNRALRAQFEQSSAQRKEEKLFGESAPKKEGALERASEEKEELKPASPDLTEEPAMQQKPEESAEQEKLVSPPEESEEPLQKISEEDSDSLEGMQPTEKIEEHVEESEPEPEQKESGPKVSGADQEEEDLYDTLTYKDRPIDISSLMRKRYGWRKSEQKDAQEDSPSRIEQEEVQDSNQTPAAESDGRESDLSLIARVRSIRERLDNLRAEGSLSEDEIASISRQYEELEALISTVPPDVKEVFEVELEKSEDLNSEEEETAEGALEGKQDSEGETESLSQDGFLENESETSIMALDSNAESEASSAANDLEDEEEARLKESREEDAEAQASSGLTAELGTEREEESDSEEDSKKLPEEQEDLQSSAKDLAREEEPESSDEEELDSEIKRIEALAARLREERGEDSEENQTPESTDPAPEEVLSERENAPESEELVKTAEEPEVVGKPTSHREETDEQETEQVLEGDTANENVEHVAASHHNETADREDEPIDQEPKQSLSDKEGFEEEAASQSDNSEESEATDAPEETGETEAFKESVSDIENQAPDQMQEIGEDDNFKEERELGQSTSFSAWLRQVSGAKSTEEKESNKEDQSPETRKEIASKIDLLDSFVEKLPELKKKRPPVKGLGEMPAMDEPEFGSEGGSLVTETLAKVYIKQKHYKKAIQAYEILKLKYPEKSSFFASQILEIKKLDK